MNAGGNRSGTRFTPRIADAATQTYLYGSTHPNSLKANHRMGAAGGGLRESHLLRGGAREGSDERIRGVYDLERWYERWLRSRELYFREQYEFTVLRKSLSLWRAHARTQRFQRLPLRLLGERSTGRILRPAVSRMRGRVQTADGGEYSSAESYSDDGYGGHSDDSRTSMELDATYSLRLDPDMDDDDRAQYILRRQGHALRSR